MQHSTTQCNTLYNMLSFKFKLAWGENCSKNRKICAKVDSRINARCDELLVSINFACLLTNKSQLTDMALFFPCPKILRPSPGCV